MTIGWIVFIVIVALVGLACAGAMFWDGESAWGVTLIVITILIALVLILGGRWYYTSTANGIRALKDQQSNLHNGIEREIIITAEDGREIYYYRGKCDIETNDNYIVFEDEEGCRQMIYWGATDTIIISEVRGN